jgi:cytochrome c556
MSNARERSKTGTFAEIRTILFCGVIVATALVGWVGFGSAHADDKKLPPGPIHDRHELMEHVGDDAEKIGKALKAGKAADAAAPAADIAASVEKFLTMFPAGSEHADSRAKPEIWTKRAEFDRLGKEMEKTATALAAAAKSGGDVKAASGAMFKNCKACHTEFRKPDEDDD